MKNNAPESWLVVFSPEQVNTIKAFGHHINKMHVDANVEPPSLELVVSLSSWSGPSAEVVCGNARGDLGDVNLVVQPQDGLTR